MADEFFLDEDEHREFTKSLENIGLGLISDHQTLSDKLAPYQGAWGTDEIGKAFEGNYLVNAEDLMAATKGAGEALVETAKYSQESADYLASVDDETARWIDSQTEPG
jgi:hypothetical protein